MSNADVRCVDDNDEVQADDKCDVVVVAAANDVTSSVLHAAVRPSITQTCSVPCDDEYSSIVCVFSHWTSWSPCSRRCDGLSTRFRFMEGSCAFFSF